MTKRTFHTEGGEPVELLPDMVESWERSPRSSAAKPITIATVKGGTRYVLAVAFWPDFHHWALNHDVAPARADG